MVGDGDDWILGKCPELSKTLRASFFLWPSIFEMPTYTSFLKGNAILQNISR